MRFFSPPPTRFIPFSPAMIFFFFFFLFAEDPLILIPRKFLKRRNHCPVLALTLPYKCNQIWRKNRLKKRNKKKKKNSNPPRFKHCNRCSSPPEFSKYIYNNPLRQIPHRLSASLPHGAGPPVQMNSAKHTDAGAFMQIHPTLKKLNASPMNWVNGWPLTCAQRREKPAA